MSEKINYANCMKRRCDECKHYDYCFRYRPKRGCENKCQEEDRKKYQKRKNYKIK
jgi:hypothetical protein